MTMLHMAQLVTFAMLVFYLQFYSLVVE